MISGARQGALMNHIAAILIVMHRCGRGRQLQLREFGRGWESVIYKNLAPLSLGSGSTSPVKKRTYTRSFSQCPHFLLHRSAPIVMDSVCFYQLYSGVGSSFPHRKQLRSSQFRTSFFHKPSPRQLFVTGQSKPADGVSRLQGAYCV